MAQLLQLLRALHADYRRTCPNLDQVALAQAESMFAQVQADPEQGRLLTHLDQYVVPTFDFAQAYYNLNTPTSEHLHDFPGSLQHRIRVICAALRAERDEYLGRRGFVMAVYPDQVVMCHREGYCYYYDDCDSESAETYWSVPYTYDEATGEVTFGARVQVEVKTMVVPVAGELAAGDTAAVDDAMVESVSKRVEPSIKFTQVVTGESTGTITLGAEAIVETQAAKFKTENGQKFSRQAYLIVPDAEKPSTWKVRVEASPGKVTVAQLGAAHAALFSSYRGKKLQAEPAQIASAKRKLRTLYKSHDAPFPGDKGAKQAAEDAGYPLWLLQGQDPPGGDEELVQTIRVRLQQDGEVGTDGVMQVKGIATVADVISKNIEVYPLEIWEDNFPRMQALIEEGRLTGECDHPEDGRASLQRTSIKFTSVWQDEDQPNIIRFTADILPTEPDGKNLQVLVSNGVAVDISSRGRGRKVTGLWQGVENVGIIQRGFRVDGFDAVKSGASPDSAITDWTLQSEEQSQTVTQEELEMGEISEKILEAIQGLTSRMDKMEAGAAGTAAADPPAPQTQSAESKANDVAVAAATGGSQLTHDREEFAYMYAQAARMRVEDELRAVAQEGWPQQWVNLYRKQLEQAAPKTLAEANDAIASRKELVQNVMDQAPRNPGNGIIKKPSRGEGGPRTPNELIERLVAHLPDDVANTDPSAWLWQDEDGNTHDAPDAVKSPRRQCRKVLQNIARMRTEGFDGPASITALMRMEQGHNPAQVEADFLNQACADGTTSVAASGAPTSAIYIFPLVVRTFPMLIANELASIQPMDRPSGKIFYKDVYRIEPTGSETDESGAVSSSRMRMDRSESFNQDYSDRAAECDTSAQIQLHLSSKDVTAESKALHAVWTTEQVQDLRAYHGLDTQQELMGAVAEQIALEWNDTMLAEMLAGATAGNVIFGTVAPTGFTKKEWEEYLSRYIDLASTKIFQKRNGEATHIVAGPMAWLQLGAAFRTGTNPAGTNPEQFAGMVLSPFMAGSSGQFKTYKTSFWNRTAYSNKILLIRRGAAWSDTSYVWAPYATYMSPVLTAPDVFTHKQGIMDRAAHKVVVGDCMATITISGVTGTAISDIT